jgi:hypothetical protein
MMFLLLPAAHCQVQAAGGIRAMVSLARSPDPALKKAGVFALRPLALYGDEKVCMA